MKVLLLLFLLYTNRDNLSIKSTSNVHDRYRAVWLQVCSPQLYDNIIISEFIPKLRIPYACFHEIASHNIYDIYLYNAYILARNGIQ